MQASSLVPVCCHRKHVPFNPFRAPKPLPVLNPSVFVPQNGFPVVQELTEARSTTTNYYLMYVLSLLVVPSWPSDYTGTLSGSRHYLTGTIEKPL